MTANILTGCRIVCSILLSGTVPFSGCFYTLYLIAGLSDAADGYIARKTHTESDLGAKLDSIADILFTAVCLFKLLPLQDLPIWLWIWIAGIAALRAANVLFGLFQRKRLILLHTSANKLTGLLLFLFPLTLPFIDLRYSAAVVCLTASFAAIQEGCIIRRGDA